MGESACLIPTFSHTSDTFQEPKQENPMNNALGESISFGRFVSEPLNWEKWSSFNQNRYIEEAEKFSKPGSVAQKKAYFEAHYKKIAAKKAAETALVEQENGVSCNDDKSPIDSKSIKDDFSIRESQEMKTIDAINGCCNVERIESETIEVENEELPLEVSVGDSENNVKLVIEDNIGNGVNHTKSLLTQGKKSSIKDAPNQEILASKIKKKPPISSPHKASSKPMAPVKLQKAKNIVVRESTEQMKATPKSVHMSINFSSRSNTISRDRTPLRTPNRASVNDIQGRPFATPGSENRRSKTLLKYSASGSKTVDAKCQSIAVDSKSSTASGSKSRSPTVFAAFNFRSEERAMKRKEFFQKLEEKFHTKETETEKLQTNAKGKAENDLKKLRQSVTSFKSKPISDCRRQLESPNYDITKMLVSRSRSPKPARIVTPSTVEDPSSRPPRRPWVKSDSSKGDTLKGDRTSTRSALTPRTRKTHENSSPNIQH